MTTKYVIDRYDTKIVSVNIVKETAKTYTIERIGYNGTAIHDRRTYDAHPLYDTWDMAKAALIERLDRKLVSLNKAVIEADKELQKAIALSPF